MRLIYFDMQHNHVHMQYDIIITCNMHVDIFMLDVTIIILHYDIVIYNAHDNIIMLHNGGILLSSILDKVCQHTTKLCCYYVV